MPIIVIAILVCLLIRCKYAGGQTKVAPSDGQNILAVAPASNIADTDAFITTKSRRRAEAAENTQTFKLTGERADEDRHLKLHRDPHKDEAEDGYFIEEGRPSAPTMPAERASPIQEENTLIKQDSVKSFVQPKDWPTSIANPVPHSQEPPVSQVASQHANQNTREWKVKFKHTCLAIIWCGLQLFCSFSAKYECGFIFADTNHVLQCQIPTISFEELEIEKNISSGPYKSVHKATWTQRFGGRLQQVAVLEFQRGLGADNKITNEISIFKRLGPHPHLVKLLAVSPKPPYGDMCLVLEFAPQGSLDHVLHDLACRREEASNIVLLTAARQVCTSWSCCTFKITKKSYLRHCCCLYTLIIQVCEAMEMLAQYAIVHCDLAARNVLVFNFHPKIPMKILVKVRLLCQNPIVL